MSDETLLKIWCAYRMPPKETSREVGPKFGIHPTTVQRLCNRIEAWYTYDELVALVKGQLMLPEVV